LSRRAKRRATRRAKRRATNVYTKHGDEERIPANWRSYTGTPAVVYRAVVYRVVVYRGS